MPDINILEPIDQQFMIIEAPDYWAEISIPGTLTRSLKNLGHYFPWSFAVTDGAPVLLLGELKILGQGYEFPMGFPDGEYPENNVWVNTGGTFETPDDWTTYEIEIYFKVISHYGTPCTVSFKDLKMMVSIAAKIQYLPIMGVG